jgi:hypothetical protein
MVLTQYSAASHAAPRPVHYRSLADARECATIDYCAERVGAATQGDSAALAPGVARYVGAQVYDSGASQLQHHVLMIIAFNVPQSRSEEVDRWYSHEHGPLLLRAPGWLRMRRYRMHHSAGGPLWTHLALHELRDADVLDSAQRAYARSTPWRARLEQESWFAQAGRWVYQYLPH